MNTDKLPHYLIRDIDIAGFSDLQHCLAYLYAGESLKTGRMVAINPEKMITAEQEPELRALIEQVEFRYADGINIVRAIRRTYPGAQIERVAGADLWQALMQQAGEKGTPVFLIGGKPEVLAEVEKRLAAWQVNIVGSQDGYFSPQEKEALLQRVRASGAAIVTVAMGSPRQELLIRDLWQVSPNALYLGVGGTYDVFSGRVKRAPLLWRKWGLEWLYRLLAQPTRWRRQGKLLRFLFYYFSGRL
ncbi:MAG: lipopolysaccharide N-acetylmannosaminouronosyltransferase [Enterobacteriaceae bacterium]